MNVIVSAVYTVCYLAFSVWQCRKLKLKLRELVIGGIACALTVLLSSIYIPLPTGAVVSIGGKLPLILIAFLLDYRFGIAAGWLSGLLCLMLVPAWAPVHWAQVFCEHLVCLSCLGYAGIFGAKSKGRILAGASLAMALNLLGHVLSGAVFFAEYVWEGWNVYAYSLVYNLSGWVPETALTLLVVSLLPMQTLKKALNSK